MRIALSALQAAVREHVDHALAAALPGALAALQGASPEAGATLEDGAVGALLLRALAGRSDVPSMALEFVLVETAAESFKLEPAAAYDHPVRSDGRRRPLWPEPGAAGHDHDDCDHRNGPLAGWEGR